MPCELALDMEFVGAFRTPGSQAHRSLVQSFNETVSPGGAGAGGAVTRGLTWWLMAVVWQGREHAVQ